MTQTPVTLANVAERAGVSVATASRVLNGSARRVNPELSARVKLAAQELGYSANVQAQAVARGTSNTVAVVVGDIADPYFARIASGVIRVAEGRGLVVTLTAAGSDPVRENLALRSLRGQRPRAIVVASGRSVDADEAELSALARSDSRVVVIGPTTSGVRSVDVRNYDGTAALAQALRARGYRDFAILAGPRNLTTARERTAGFVSQVPAARVVHGSLSRDGGYDTMAALLSADVRPDCVFAVTDMMALGAMAALRDAGLRPGADVGVAGFDDIPLMSELTPSLTTVALPLAEIGARAFEVALADEHDAALAEPYLGTVILRDSTPGRGDGNH